MFEFFKRMHVRRERAMFNSGYSYAAGQLLKGKTIDEVELEVDIGCTFDRKTSFEVGMQAAVGDWCTLRTSLYASLRLQQVQNVHPSGCCAPA